MNMPDQIHMVDPQECGPPDPDPYRPPDVVYGFRLARWTEGGQTYGPGSWTFVTDDTDIQKIRAAGYEVVKWTR